MSSSKGRKKGFGEILHDVMYEGDNSSEKTPAFSPPPRVDSSVVPVFKSTRSTESSPAPAVASMALAGADPEMVKEITEMLDQRSSAAYHTFSDLLVRLAAMPDDATRFTAALATAPAMSLKVADIHDAYEERPDILDKLQEHFEEQSQAEYDRRVSSTEQEVKDLDKKIADLTSELQECSQERAAKADSIKGESQKIASVKAQMLSAFAAVKAKVTNERDTLSRHTTGK